MAVHMKSKPFQPKLSSLGNGVKIVKPEARDEHQIHYGVSIPPGSQLTSVLQDSRGRMTASIRLKGPAGPGPIVAAKD